MQMKSSLFVFSLFFILNPNVFGQNISWGEGSTDDKFINNILAEKNGIIYTISSNKEEHFLELYDSNNFNQISSNKIKLPKIENVASEAEYFTLFQGKVACIFSAKIGKERIYKIAYLETSGKTGDETKELFRLEVIKKRHNLLQLNLSNNGEYLAIHTSQKKNKVRKLAYIVINKDLVKEQSGTHNLITTKRQVDRIESVMISNEQDLFFLVGSVMLKNNEYNILKFNNGSLSSYKLSPKAETRLGTVALALDEEKKVLKVLGICYNDKLTFNKRIIGTYSQSMDLESLKLGRVVQDNFTNEKLIDFGKELKGKGNNKLMPDYNLKDILLTKDKGVLLVAEKDMTIVKKGSGIISSKTLFVKGNLMVIKLDENGVQQWVKCIAKKQQYANYKYSLGPNPGLQAAMMSADNRVKGGTGALTFEQEKTIQRYRKNKASFGIGNNNDKARYMSYFLVNKGSDYYFVFNDHKENVAINDVDKLKALEKLKESALVVVKVSDDGSNEKIELSTASESIIYCPQVSLKQGETIFIYANSKKEEKIGRIEMKE